LIPTLQQGNLFFIVSNNPFERSRLRWRLARQQASSILPLIHFIFISISAKDLIFYSILLSSNTIDLFLRLKTKNILIKHKVYKKISSAHLFAELPFKRGKEVIIVSAR